MNAFFALIVTCLAVAAHGFPNTQIVGGKDAPIGKFPYQVSLRKYGKLSCGGSILNQYTILTAAHCLQSYSDPNALKDLTVHTGTNLLSEIGTVYKVKQAIPHKNFSYFTLTDDIGLLILSTPIKYTKYVQPIPLATTDIAPSGSSCILSGWGTTSLRGKIPDKLQEIELNVYDQAKCKQYHRLLESSQICTLTRVQEGACHGDSGGPLVLNGVQVGIVSYGSPCARGNPDVYTRVSSFNDWIQKHIVE